MSIPYPALERHGLIGDRRTAALVAADGTVDWLCLPDYDGPALFGSILDFQSGGHWRWGPATRVQGHQSYTDDTWGLETHWSLETGTLVLSDTMLWPETRRTAQSENSRALVRILRCTRGKVRTAFDLQAAFNFQAPATTFVADSLGFLLTLKSFSLRVWTSDGLKIEGSSLRGLAELQEGEELWSVLEIGTAFHRWSAESARSELEQTRHYWRGWARQLGELGASQPCVRRTALLAHLLTYAPEGSVVAAPTTSLPERVGGSWNADYRLCWVRDTSLALGMLARLGDLQETERYLEWLAKRESAGNPPLQVLYDPRGGKNVRQRQKSRLAGYRGSQPVRLGNHASSQLQFGSLGFLADCTWIYLQENGPWREEYWDLIRHCADYVAKHWRKPDNGIWELSRRKNYVHSKVLCWVMLDRAVKIAQKLQKPNDITRWETEGARIYQQVMEKGWSPSLGAFRQSYEADTLDAAELLISVMEFLPGTHPRVLQTIDRIAELLTIDGLVYRFNPIESGVDTLPLGEFEAAFLPCTFWLATAYVKAGRLDKADDILKRTERLVGKNPLFPEGVDPRTGAFRGNTPLLFSHVEYVRAKLELALAQSKSRGYRKAA